METYRAETYGDRIAGHYDEWYASADTAMVATLAELAGPGPALELGVGTGRIALPLRERGVEVHGIDASPGMIEKLHAKPGGQAIPVTLGDFGEIEPEGRYSLVYVVFNTFFALLSQEAQVRCFRNVAGCLAEGGSFLLEVFVPDPARLAMKNQAIPVDVTADLLHLNVAKVDLINQRVNAQHIVMTDGAVRMYPVQIRYAWPAELDLMAQLAGLELRYRWGGWSRERLAEDAGRHISVYARKAKP